MNIENTLMSKIIPYIQLQYFNFSYMNVKKYSYKKKLHHMVNYKCPRNMNIYN